MGKSLRMSAVKVECVDMEYNATMAAYGHCTRIKHELPGVGEFTAEPSMVQDIKLQPLCVSVLFEFYMVVM